jgi:hypothetical protein
MCQVSDVEEEAYGPVLRAVCASLQLEDEWEGEEGAC